MVIGTWQESGTRLLTSPRTETKKRQVLEETSNAKRVCSLLLGETN